MTVQATLEFVTNAAATAREAAAAVTQFRGALLSLASMSSINVDLGTNLSSQIDQATESATRLAAVLSEAANDARRVGAALNTKSSAEREKDRQARAAEKEQQTAAKSAHIREHSEAKIAEIRAKNEAQLAQIEAKRKAQAERDARKEATIAKRKPMPVTEETTSGIGGAARAVLEGQGLKGALGAFGGRGAVAGAVIELATRAAATVADLSFQFGKSVVAAQAYKEDVTEAFTVVRKTAAAGEATMLRAAANADRLGASRAEVAGQYLDLATKGFDDAKIDQIVGSLYDLTAIDPNASMAGLTKVIGKAQATGRLNVDILSELSTFGLEQADVIKEIGKVLGKTDQEVLKALSASGGIRGLGVDPIIAAIQSQANTKVAGDARVAKVNRDMSVLLQRIEDIPSNVLIDLDAGPGLDAIKEVMREVLGYFAAGTESGQRVRKVVGDLFNALAEGLFGARPSDKDGIRGTLDTIVEIAEKGTPAVRSAAEAVGTLARVVLALGSGDKSGLDESTKRLVGIVNLIKELGLLLAPGGTFGPGGVIQPILDILGIDADATEVRKWVDAVAGMLNPANIFRTIKAVATGGDATLGNPILQAVRDAAAGATEAAFGAASTIGTNIIDGIVGGIEGGIQRVKDAASSMASGALDAAKSALGIASPSRLMRDEVGAMAGEGLAIGYERSIPRVMGAATDLVQAGLGAASVEPFPLALPSGLALGTPANTTAPALSLPPIVININVTVPPGADPNAVAAAIEGPQRQIIREEITAYFLRTAGA